VGSVVVFAWRFSATRRDRREDLPPGFVEPALATSTDKLAFGERWIHEIKLDGYSPSCTFTMAPLRSSPAAAATGQGASAKIAADRMAR